MSQYFTKQYKPFGGDVSVKVDLSNYATKADFKNISHVDSSRFALKTNLASLKTEVDKLNIEKLMSVLTDLGKLDNVLKIKKKGDKLYVKWKRYDSSFNSWIDKKDLV